MNERITDAIIGGALALLLVLIVLLSACGTDNKRDHRSTVRPDSINVGTTMVSDEPTVVEVCKFTHLNRRRIRRFLCKKRKNKKACRRKVNRLLDKSNRFPRSLEVDSE